MRFVFLGLNFFESIKNEFYFYNLVETQKKHSAIWSLLLLTLKLDITEKLEENKLKEDIGKMEVAITKIEKTFNEVDHKIPFPSSAVLLFRRYFLDDVSTFDL